ncbi:MAG: NB-ARC domain-containing protein, partial [Bacteroidia bacterium]|nr:NB-ARC domain-containing protein [Bacteroidia bacterium]
MIESIRDAIARNDLTEALKLLRTLLDNSPQLDEILVQSGRFHAIRKQIRLGLVSHAEASIAHAQILAGLTDLLREIEEQSQKPAIRQEIAQVIHYHYYHDRKIPRNLTAPPFYPEVFIGRETEMDTLHRKLFSGTNLLLLVNGQGGVGKTSLASRYYHRYQSDYAHTAWLLSESRIAFALLRLAQP